MLNRWVLVAAVMVAAGWARADVPGPKSICSAPAECMGCAVSDSTCLAAAADAGLVNTECTTQRGVPVTYYCPPGVQPVQSCGCSGGVGAGAVLFAALLFARRRNAR